jgi:hypothetical protein
VTSNKAQNRDECKKAQAPMAETPPSVLEESKHAEDSRQTNVNDRNVNVMFGIPIKQR